jgi:hypothetical protein
VLNYSRRFCPSGVWLRDFLQTDISTAEGNAVFISKVEDGLKHEHIKALVPDQTLDVPIYFYALLLGWGLKMEILLLLLCIYGSIYSQNKCDVSRCICILMEIEIGVFQN